MSDSEKVLRLMKYLHFSSVHRENELRQARENVLQARHEDTAAHLEYFAECCRWEICTIECIPIWQRFCLIGSERGIVQNPQAIIQN